MRQTVMKQTVRCWASSLGLAIALVAAGCGKPEKPEKKARSVQIAQADDLSDAERGEVVAKVGGAVITLADFERKIAQQSPFGRARYNSLQRKKEFLDSLIRFELLALAAEEKGYDQKPDVVLAKKQAMVRELMAEEVSQLVSLSDITDADVKAYYDEHMDKYDKPAQVRAAHLLLDDEAAARALLAEIRAKTEKAPTKARDIFSDYVRRLSRDDQTRDRGGDLQFFGKPGESRGARGPMAPELPPPVALAAFELEKVGALAPAPVKSSKGWHLVQKTGFKRPYRRSLKDVERSIKNKLYRVKKGKAMEAYVASLREKASIEIRDEVLEKAKVKRRPGGLPTLAPPSFSGARPTKLDLPGMPRGRLPGMPGGPRGGRGPGPR